ncbi:homogentisate solanesyltransferase, partial [Quercus suber]
MFAPVIAVTCTKDLPDVPIKGDIKYQISTFLTKLGVRNIAFLGTGLLLVNYVASVLAAIYMPQAFNRSLMIPAHVKSALILISRTMIFAFLLGTWEEILAWVLEQANYTKQKIVIKVQMTSDKCRTKAMKIAAKTREKKKKLDDEKPESLNCTITPSYPPFPRFCEVVVYDPTKFLLHH